MHAAFGLSGESIAPQVSLSYGTAPSGEMNASKIAATNVAKREFQKEYMEYWNSTKDLTNTGRPIDAFITPVAPFTAARPETFKYYGYTTFVNLLDYTSCTIPVTTADEQIDIRDEQFKPTSEIDKDNYDTCKIAPLLDSN